MFWKNFQVCFWPRSCFSFVSEMKKLLRMIKRNVKKTKMYNCIRKTSKNYERV